jgi:hypothetical protein
LYGGLGRGGIGDTSASPNTSFAGTGFGAGGSIYLGAVIPAGAGSAGVVIVEEFY